MAPPPPLLARTRNGDKYLLQGRASEAKKDYDGALELFQKALHEDPADILYQMAVEKARFQASQLHLDRGLKARIAGSLPLAQREFTTAFALNPASSVALQELKQTKEMIEREDKRERETGHRAAPEIQGLTPVQTAKREFQDQIASMRPVPQLKAFSPQPINLKMTNQRPRILFETVCKLANINLLVDPEYQEGKAQSIEFTSSTLDQALDYLAVLTRSYWKPLSSNAIFVTNDNITKRKDFEEQVARVFYLTNTNTPQELQEIVTAVRSVADLQRVFVYNSQNAIVVRGELDKVALAGKIIADLDKPKSEVVVDIIVMEASSAVTRKLTTAIASTGLSSAIAFAPRSSIASTTTSSTTSSTTSTSTTTSTTTIPLSKLSHLSTSDYSVVLPDALLQAVLSDAQTRVLQSPQLRSVDNQKATLKIGNRQPTATGSYSSTTVSSLVSTQFTYIDVGVNVDLTPRVHENGEISIHVELEISSVNGYVTISSVSEPIIGQRKVIHDIRIRDGEINLLGGLINVQDTKTKTGIPGLSSVPLLGRLFSGDEVDHTRNELMIALIPHIVRRPEITVQNLKSISVGNSTTVKLNYAPKAETAAKPAPETGKE
jgi:general secretion pathway protein D